MRHIIATRLGVGIARQSFFSHHIDLLSIGLAECLSKQTIRDFEWVVIADHWIDSANRARLEKVIAPANGKPLYFDPVSKRRMLPNPYEMAGDIKEPILMTRIDDDDIIGRDFVELLQSGARTFDKNHSSIALADGLDLYLGSRSYRPFHHPTTPVGLSVFSLPQTPVSAYSGNHNKMHERTGAQGGDVKIIRTQEAVWGYIRRDTSDSADYRRPASGLKDNGHEVEALMARCGLPADWVDEADKLHKSEIDPRPKVIGTSMARLALKNQYLAILRDLDKQEASSPQKVEALVAALYAF